MKASNDAIPASCVQVVHVLADSEVTPAISSHGELTDTCSSLSSQVCVRTMAKCDAIAPLMMAMKRREDMIHTAAETIKKLYDLCIPELVVQVYNMTLV